MHTILQAEELICENNRANTHTHIPRHTPPTLALRYTRSFSACTHAHTYKHTHHAHVHAHTQTRTRTDTHTQIHTSTNTYANTASRYVYILTGARQNCINTYINRNSVSYVFS